MKVSRTAGRGWVRVHRSSIAIALAMGLVACDAETELPLEAEPAPSFARGPWSPWSEPVPVEGINTAAAEMRAALSKDGSSLYFHSNRPGGLGQNDLWVARRDCAGCPWQGPVNLGAPVNTADHDESGPALSRDGHWLFFHSNRTGGSGGNDIWASYRAHVHDDLAWGAPVNLGPGVNSPGGESQPSYFENDGGRPHLFFARAGIHVSEMRADGSWGEARLVDALAAFNGPSIHPSGLEMYMFRSSRVWHATRESTHAPWSAPVELSELTPGVASVFQPFIHAHGGTETLFVGGVPSPGAPGDLYVTTRSR